MTARAALRRRARDPGRALAAAAWVLTAPRGIDPETARAVLAPGDPAAGGSSSFSPAASRATSRPVRAIHCASAAARSSRRRSAPSSPEHFAGSPGWDRRLERARLRQCADGRRLARRPASLSGVSLSVLRADVGQGRAGPLRASCERAGARSPGARRPTLSRSRSRSAGRSASGSCFTCRPSPTRSPRIRAISKPEAVISSRGRAIAANATRRALFSAA